MQTVEMSLFFSPPSLCGVGAVQRVVWTDGMNDARLGLVLTVVGATAAGFGAAVLTHRWCTRAPLLPPRRHAPDADGMRAVQRQALALLQTQRRAGALVAEARARIDCARAAQAQPPAQCPPYPALFASYAAMRASDFSDIRLVSTRAFTHTHLC